MRGAILIHRWDAFAPGIPVHQLLMGEKEKLVNMEEVLAGTGAVIGKLVRRGIPFFQNKYIFPPPKLLNFQNDKETWKRGGNIFG